MFVACGRIYQGHERFSEDLQGRQMVFKCLASHSQYSLEHCHFQSGINFLCAGTIALIFINYNVQLVLSQVPLGSLINRTEIGTASISVLLLQFLLRCICDVLNSVLHV